MRTIAIITPIFATPENGRLDYFPQTLYSVRAQNLSPSNHIVQIVVDDGSTVDVEGYINELHDPRIRYLRREKNPQELWTASHPLNFGIDYCLSKSGDILTRTEAHNLEAVCFLHSDDLLYWNSIEERYRGLGVGFVHTEIAFFNNKRRVLLVRRGIDAKDQGHRNLAAEYNFLFNGHTVMWQLKFLQYVKDFVGRKYEQSGVFDPMLRLGEDLDVFLSSTEAAIEGEYSVDYVAAVSVLYRFHRQSISGDDNNPQSIREQAGRLYRKHFAQQIENSRVGFLTRVKVDPFWFWFTYLAPELKEKFAQVKYNLKGKTFRLKQPKVIKSLEQYLSEIIQ
mgnify:CR=1 FL=1